ncbi:hypothetical protein OIV83_004680 [Microbotryomycetes sp. JL201]|nr:hypothetical protein OIV83_004680 [Microbotryomycetes sp. JL201]
MAQTTTVLAPCTCQPARRHARQRRSQVHTKHVSQVNGPVATTSAVKVEQLDELLDQQHQQRSTDAQLQRRTRRRNCAVNGRIVANGTRPNRRQHRRQATAGVTRRKRHDDGHGVNDSSYARNDVDGGSAGAGDDDDDDEYKRCEAIDRYGVPCREIVVGGIKGKVFRQWCITHEKEELVVRQEFYRCSDDVVDIGSDLGLPSASEMHSIDDLDELEDIESTVQDYIALCDKTIKSCAYHVQHFGAAGNLAAYSPVPLELVADRLAHARQLMDAIMDVSHTLIVESEDADWLVLKPDPTDVPCSDAPTSPLRPPNPPPLQNENEEPDPVVALERVERASLLETLSLTGSHASFITNSRRSLERVRIIECLFRRLICRDRDLLVKSYRSNHDHVLRALEDPECCDLPALQRIHMALRRTSALQLKDAIMDAFRAIQWEESGAGETEPGEEGMGLQLLGGWRYAYPLRRSMTRAEWGHLYDLCACPDCAVRCCTRFQDLAMIRRLTVVPNGPEPPPFELWGDSGETDAGRILRALDIVKCCESGTEANDAETRKVGSSLLGNKGKGLWVERVERNWMFLKISITHFKPLAVLDALSEDHVVVVRSRVTPDYPLPSYPLPHPTHLWFSRHRSAAGKPGLKHAAWQSDPDEFGPGNSEARQVYNVLDSLDSPEKSQGMAAFEETYEVLVLDGYGHDGEGTGRAAVDHSPRPFAQFEASVGRCVSRACGIRDVRHALECGMFVSFRQDEMVWTWGFQESDEDEIDADELERKRQLGWRAFFEGKDALGGLRKMSRVIEREARLIAERRRQAEAIAAAAEQARHDAAAAAAKEQGADARQTNGVETAAVPVGAGGGRLLDDDLAFRLSRSLFR